MKLSKKALTLILALVIAVGALTVGLFAASNSDRATVKLAADKTEVAPGGTVTFTVKITTDFYASTVGIPVYYDASKFTLSSASALIDGAVTVDSSSSEYTRLFANSGLSQEKYGAVGFAYVARKDAALSKYSDTAVLRFALTAKADVSGSSYVFCNPKSLKKSASPEGMLYFGKNSSGTAVTDSLAEVVENVTLSGTTVSVNISATAPYISKGDSVEIDEINRLLSIVPSSPSVGSLSGYFTVKNGSFLSSGNGTGDTVTVKDGKGAVYSEYTLIVKGDVNGDGQCTIEDYSAVKLNIAYGTEPDGNAYFSQSADFNSDTAVDAFDMFYIDKTMNGIN